MLHTLKKQITIIHQHYTARTCNILILLLVFSSAYVINIQRSNYLDWSKVVLQTKNKQSNIVFTNEVQCNKYMERFILRYLTPESSEFYSSFIKENNKENLRFAQYFNRDSIQFIPQRFANMVMSEPKAFTHLYNNKILPFYVIELKGKKEIDKVFLLMDRVNDNEIPFYYRPFAHNMARFTLSELETKHYSTTNINNKDYLLIGKNKNLDSRIKNIKIIYKN